jgi:hypothetical protein
MMRISFPGAGFALLVALLGYGFLVATGTV